MKRMPLFAAVACAWAATALAQIAPEEQARRLLEDGRAAFQAGRTKQALDNFNTIVTGFPSTSSVDDALLEIGRYYAEVERDLGKARESFDAVSKRFPQSDGAPGAYWNLGWLGLQTARTASDLDDAIAQFARVQRLYPRSDWVPRALYATAIAQRRAGRLEMGVAAARRVVLEYPGSESAPAAQLELGQTLALLGRHAQAMEAFQEIRNRWPASDSARQALDRITALYRLHGNPQPAFRPDPSYSIGAGDVLKEVVALASAPDGTLWIVSEKTSAAIPFSVEGRMGASLNTQDPRSFTLAANGDTVLASRLAVRVGPRDVRSFTTPGSKPGETEPVDKITAALPLPGGGILVADEKRKRVLRFDEAGKFIGPFPDNNPREVIRLLLDPDASVLMLDKDARTVTVVEKTGKVLRTVGPTGAGYSFRKPVDLAVDPFRNLYVADEELGVTILGPDGRFLAQLAGEEIKKPRALTLDPTGAVLVYDSRTQRIVRFR